MSKKTSIILVVAIICFGLLVTGGTYAWLSFGTVINGETSGNSTCFVLDYNYNDNDGDTKISGTLFQSTKPRAGLSGSVTMSINSNCDVLGVGYIYITVNDSTSAVLLGSSALGYVIYDHVTGEELGSGTISSKGKKLLFVYPGLSHTSRTFDIYIWLNGEVANNSYINATFDGDIHLEAEQVEQPAYGDADISGNISIMDVTVITNIISYNVSSYSSQQIKNADVNDDGVVTDLDETFVSNNISGKGCNMLPTEPCTE